MRKKTPTLADQAWGIGCTLLIVSIVLVFVYYVTGGDVLIVGVVVLVAVIAGLYGLISGNPINN